VTQRRNADPNSLSNWFDRQLTGIGHRGSSFTDLDRLDWSPMVFTQNDVTGRVLVQEFKQDGEKKNPAQFRALRGLARIAPQKLSVWCVVRRRDGFIGWCDVATFVRTKQTEIITLDEFRGRFRRWWENGEGTYESPRAAMLDVSEIFR
jgi:hypothetical protein